MTRADVLALGERNRSHARTVELALEALTWAMCDEQLPRDLRRDIALVHARLHEWRPMDVVKAMEREQGLMPEGTSK